MLAARRLVLSNRGPVSYASEVVIPLYHFGQLPSAV